MRILDKLVQEIIDNEGTVDGLNPVNSTGVVRLALDLKEARKALKLLKEIHEHFVEAENAGVQGILYADGLSPWDDEKTIGEEIKEIVSS